MSDQVPVSRKGIDSPSIEQSYQDTFNPGKERALHREYGNAFADNELIDITDLNSANPNLPEGVQIVQRESKNYADKFVFQPFIDKDGNHRKYPVPMRWHITPIVQNIINHNKTMQYTGLVLIGMCLVKGSKIVMGDGGIRNIDSLADKHLQKINLSIRTTQTKNDIATRYHKYEDMRVIEVITSSGKSVTGTYQHPLMVNGNWITMQDLSIGDSLDSVKMINSDIVDFAPTNFKSLKLFKKPILFKMPKTVTDELASLIGVIVGNGINKNDELTPILSKYITTVFGVYQETRLMAQILSKLNYDRIPEMIFCSPNGVLAKFISWTFELNANINNDTIVYHHDNIELLRDIQLALLRFGVLAIVDNSKITIYDKKSITRFISNIGFQSELKITNQTQLLKSLRKIRQQPTYVDKIVKIIHHNDPVTVYDVDVPKSHRFITNGGIISHNSGTGKTTLTRTILHRMHEMGENYRVLWFTGTDMLNIDKIINSCQVGVPHVFVFDDASYTMEDARKEDVARLANALTTIRHHLKSRAIIIMNIHYSKATKKFFRNQHFTFLTSVTAEEMGNYSDLFKEKMGVVRKFAKYYNQSALKGGFYIPVSSATYEQLYYKTNEPFRIGLVAEISDLHFFLYDRQECETCNPMTFKKIRDYSTLKTDLVGKYGVSKVRSVLQFFAMIYDNKTDGDNKKKIQYLNPDYIAIWKNFAEINRNIYVPWGRMLEELRSDISVKKKQHKPGGVQKFRDRTVMSVMEQYKKELEEENNKKGIGAEFMGPPEEKSTTGYDSTFVGSKNTRFRE